MPQLPVAEQRDAAGKGRKVGLIHGATAESIFLGDSGKPPWLLPLPWGSVTRRWIALRMRWSVV